MTSGSANHTAHRIVIGFKAAHDSDPSVQAATTLAAAIGAEVVGVYVREETMIDLAGLPFARAINAGTAQRVPLTQETMEQALRSGAVTCRRTLSVVAGKAQVKWSFNIKQGELTEQTEKALVSGDFLVLDCEGHELGMRFPIKVLRSMPRQASGVVIAARRRTFRSNGPIIAIDDGDAAGRQTVVLAARLAKASGVSLELFVLAQSDAEAERIALRARDLVDPEVTLGCHRFMPTASGDIAASFSLFSPSFIVADLNGEPFNDDASAQTLFRAAKAPIVLLQTEDKVSQSEL